MPVVEDDFGYAKFRFFNCGLKIMLNVCELDECTIWKVLIFINCLREFYKIIVRKWAGAVKLKLNFSHKKNYSYYIIFKLILYITRDYIFTTNKLYIFLTIMRFCTQYFNVNNFECLKLNDTLFYLFIYLFLF